jgi:hypothetical protein
LIPLNVRIVSETTKEAAIVKDRFGSKPVIGHGRW